MNYKRLCAGLLALSVAFGPAGQTVMVRAEEPAQTTEETPGTETPAETTVTPEPTENPGTVSPTPSVTPTPETTVTPTPTPSTTTTPTPSRTPAKKPAKKKISLAKPVIKSVKANENWTVTVKWKKVKKATGYEIYRSTKKSKGFKKIAKTSKKSYTDKSTTTGKTYYYKVRATAKATKTTLAATGKFSKVKSVTCRKTPQRIAYLGDSVMNGFQAYGVLSDKRERSFAKISLRISAMNSEVLPSVLAYNPDRVFIMIGTNDIVGNPSDASMSGALSAYYTAIDRLHAKNPSVEVVIMGLGPTRGSTKITNNTVKRFNALLKKMADSRKFATYFDTGCVLRDGSGAMKSGYAGYDGIHWSAGAYRAVYAQLKATIKPY